MLSVIVPIYNRAAFLEDALDSLIAAVDDGDEILLVDDGSTDESAAMAQHYLQTHPGRFRLLRQENRGYGAACNAGLRAAAGRHVAIFEPDDRVDPGFYRDLAAVAEATGADMVRANGFYKFRDDGAPPRIHGDFFGDCLGVRLPRDFQARFWTMHPCIWNAVYNRQTLASAGVRFTEGAGASFQDEQFRVSLYYAVQTVAVAPVPGYRYREHEGQSVNHAEKRVAAIVENWRSELDWLRENGHTDLAFYMNSTFVQFRRLYSVKVKGADSRGLLLKAMRGLARETGVRRLDYPGAKTLNRVLFRLLWCYRWAQSCVSLFDWLSGLSARRARKTNP